MIDYIIIIIIIKLYEVKHLFLKINVFYVDEKPRCTQVRYNEVIYENVAPGTYILTVLATDADLESKVKFFLTGEAAHHFYLDRDTGI